jgi:hypothetical protein
MNFFSYDDHFYLQIIINDSKRLLDDSNKKIYDIIELTNFDSFDQLLILIAIIKQCFVSFIEIKPNKKLIFSNSLNFNGSIIMPINYVFSIMLNNF